MRLKTLQSIPTLTSPTHRSGRVLAALLASLLAVGPAMAANAPISLEGPIESIVQTSPTTATVICDGVAVQVRSTTLITSPLHRLTLEMLTSAAPLPAAGFSPLTGQRQQGFIGGICIMDGMRDDATGVTVATLLNVDVGETVLSGNVSNAPARNGKPLAIAGVDIVPIDDPRLNAVEPATGLWKDANGTLNAVAYFETVHNSYGFGVDPTKIGFLRNGTATLDAVSAAGYLGTDGKFHAFEITVTNPANILDRTPRATITDGDVQDSFVAGGDRMTSRGGCLLPSGKTSTVVTVAGEVASGNWQTYGQATCTLVAADAPFGRWKLDVPKTTFLGSHVPYRLRVSMAGTVVPLYDFIVPQQRVVAVPLP